MLSISQLLLFTSSDRKRFSTNYVIESLSKKEEEDSIGEFILFSGLITGGKEPRVSSAKIYGSKPDPDAFCKVSCTCPYFKIKLASALYRAGSTDKNPRIDESEELRRIQKPGLCPHLLHLLETLLSPHYKDLREARTAQRRTRVSDRLRGLT